MNETHHIHNTTELKKLLEKILTPIVTRKSDNKEGGATCIALIGDLGAGKTTTTQYIGEILGIQEPMQSPTFVLERTYGINWHGFDTLSHYDMYRLEESELPTIRFHERMSEPSTLVVIEWADRIMNSLPIHTHFITLSRNDDESRTVIYKKGKE